MSLKSMGPSRRVHKCRNRERGIHHISELEIEVT